jgi:hypothetical protein
MAVPGCPDIDVPLVIAGTGPGGAIVSTRVTVPPVPTALLALSCTLKVPAAVGVPEIVPVIGFVESAVNERPAGSEPTFRLVAPVSLSTVTVYVKGVPTVPDAVAALVIVGVPAAGETASVTSKLLVTKPVRIEMTGV